MDSRARTQLQVDMVRLADGDRSAFTPVFEALWPVVRAFVAKQLPAAQVDDAAQEVLTKVFYRASDYDPARDAAAWAVGIAAYEVRTLRRQAWRRKESPGAPADRAADAPSPEEHALRQDFREAALEVVGTLSAEDAATLSALATGDRPAVPGATFRKRVERSLKRFRLAWRTKHGPE